MPSQPAHYYLHRSFVISASLGGTQKDPGSRNAQVALHAKRDQILCISPSICYYTGGGVHELNRYCTMPLLAVLASSVVGLVVGLVVGRAGRGSALIGFLSSCFHGLGRTMCGSSFAPGQRRSIP